MRGEAVVVNNFQISGTDHESNTSEIKDVRSVMPIERDSVRVMRVTRRQAENMQRSTEQRIDLSRSEDVIR